jgi:hypothetical protein
MAVTQYFTVDLPETVEVAGAVNQDEIGANQLTLSRSDAESLCNDLAEALGWEVGSAVAGPQEGIQAALADAVARYLEDQDRFDDESASVGKQMTPDEALARMQAEQQLLSAPAAVRNPGTGIGNG